MFLSLVNTKPPTKKLNKHKIIEAVFNESRDYPFRLGKKLRVVQRQYGIVVV